MSLDSICNPSISSTGQSAKICAVPYCPNNILVSPNKLFVKVPSDHQLRRLWLQRANIEVYVSSSPNVYFCEDHFEERIRPTEVDNFYGLPTKFNYQNASLVEDIDSQQEKIRPAPKKKSNKLNLSPDLLEAILCRPQIQLTATATKPAIPKLQKKALSKIPKYRPKGCCNCICGHKITEKKIFNTKDIICYRQTDVWNDIQRDLRRTHAMLDHNYAKGPLLQFQYLTRLKRLRQRIDRINELHKINKKFKEFRGKTCYKDVGGTKRSRRSVETFICGSCNIEYLNEKYLFQHIEEEHFGQKKPLTKTKKRNSLLSFDKKLKRHDDGSCKNYEIPKECSKRVEYNKDYESTDTDSADKEYRKHLTPESTSSAESFETFRCNYCGIEYIYKADLTSHIEEQHSEVQEETLDIKPEIFQCSKCPCSFLNEEEMSNHLRVMHGDVIDKIIQNIYNNQNDVQKPKDSLVHTENSKDGTGDKCHTVDSQGSVTGYNFAELRTEVEIKREYTDPLEDVELNEYGYFGEENLGSNLIYGVGQDAPENNDNVIVDYASTDFEPALMTVANTFTIKQEEINNYQSCHSEQDSSDSNAIKCKCCKIQFSSQEELLNHMHELINSKAKYNNAKKVLETNASQGPGNKKCPKRSRKAKMLTCRRCSKPLPSQTRKASKKSRICVSCKKIRNTRQRNTMKAQLCASVKNTQFKELKDVKPEMSKHKNKPSGLTDEQILENMHKFFLKTQMKNGVKIERESPILGDNDLLKPLREEDEKILVQPHNPSLCKSCLKPLEKPKNSGQNKAVCDKCKAIETSIEWRKSDDKRRKSNEKRRISEDIIRKSNYKIDKECFVKLEKIKLYGCNICRVKFLKKLDLREHVARSHL